MFSLQKKGMKIIIIGTAEQKKEFLNPGTAQCLDLTWQNDLSSTPEADCYIDLLFDNSKERKLKLSSIKARFMVVNAVHFLANDLPENFIRINGWPGFLEKPVLEAACRKTFDKEKMEAIFMKLGKKIEWVGNYPGLVSARVISMIINEAYLALEENVSSKEEIDIAMKLGTNYPFGPFEWSQKIGLINIHSLLSILAASDSKYTPATLLTKETFSK